MKEQIPLLNISTERPKEEELPEVLLQQEIREGFEKTYGSADTWYVSAILGEELTSEQIARMLLTEKAEFPQLVTAVLERTCNLRCPHCLYQDEHSSASISRSSHLDEVIINAVKQLGAPVESENPEIAYSPQFMSGGRILRPNHLKLFAQLRSIRPDVALGVIDNGTFTKLLKNWPEGFMFDWMDISIDGPEAIHNKQRGADEAFSDALFGLKQARSVVRGRKDGVGVTSLFTLTNINSSYVLETADMLLDSSTGVPLIDKFLMTTLSPTNDVNTEMRISVDDFGRAWEQIKIISEKYNGDGRDRFSFNIYRTDDMEKLAAVVGEKEMIRAFSSEGGLGVERNFLHAVVDGVPISYQPLAIWTPEEFLIEADGAYRTAYEGKFTLDELRSGISKDGQEDTRPYTIEQLTAQSDIRAAYEHGVDHYWAKFGKDRLQEDRNIWSRIRDKAA